jgi:hypothetical protein
VQKSTSAGRQHLPSRTALSNEFLRRRFSGPKNTASFTLLGGVLYTALHLPTPRFSVRERSPRKPQPPIPHRFADQTAQTFAPKKEFKGL